MTTKLYVPRLRPDLVSRPRLLERLDPGTGTRLTLVSAPAGFGKTTLLAEWLGARPGADRLAWLSLDAGDHDPASFWAYVVSALQTAVPGLGPTLMELVASVPLPTRLVVTTLVNALAAAPGEVWLVLDDYHLVDDPEVAEGLALLLEHLPPQVHVVISTRADPDLPLPRWRVRGELVEVRAADLRFTSGEAAAYLTAATGLHLDVGQVAALEGRTEGWIAALQLAAISLRDRDDVGTFVAEFAGTDRYVVDYLVEEVLAQQPAAVRSFLLRSAVLDRLSGPSCDAVTGLGDGSGTLEALDRANLFLVALDDRREWYRYHHLFADVLRARLLADQPDLVPELHRRASRWYEEHGSLVEAVGHALAGVDPDRAAYLMELAVPQIRRQRQEAVLPGWLSALPDAVVRRSPVLSFCSAAVLLVSGDLDAVEARLADAERALTTVPASAQTSELETLPADIEVYRASVAQARGDAQGTAEHARRALDLTRPGDHLARGGALGFLGLAAWARGDVATAATTFASAVASLHAAGNLLDELSSTVVVADLWLATGRPRTARRLYERALAQAGSHGEPVARATADLHVGLSELDHEAGDPAGARRHLEAAATLGEGSAQAESRYRWFLSMGRVVAAAGDTEGATRLLDQAEDRFRPGFFPDVRPVAAVRARVWLAHGRLTEAAGWARDHGAPPGEADDYLREFEQLTVARVLLAEHRAHRGTSALDRAAALLDRLLAAAESSGRGGSTFEIRLLQALVLDAQGHRSRAVEALGRALAEVPEPEGYARLLLDEGDPMTALLRAALQRGVLPVEVGRLLRLTAAAEPDDAVGRSVPASVPGGTLSERELQVLRLLDTELTGPLIARQLFISHNTLRTHTKHIFSKLDVSSRRAAVRRARERGLL